MAELLDIEIQATPNPQAVKFTLNRVVAAAGKTYRDAEQADVAWAKALLALPGVAQVFAVNNFISVTKTTEASWDGIFESVGAILERSFS